MKNKKEIYGYLFAINIEPCENGYLATAPGVGGVYEEGKTEEEAKRLAYESASAILEARFNNDDLLTEDNEYIKVLWSVPKLKNLRSNWGNKQINAEPYIITLPNHYVHSSLAQKAVVI